jgi:hypothetical protein
VADAVVAVLRADVTEIKAIAWFGARELAIKRGRKPVAVRVGWRQKRVQS